MSKGKTTEGKKIKPVVEKIKPNAKKALDKKKLEAEKTSKNTTAAKKAKATAKKVSGKNKKEIKPEAAKKKSAAKEVKPTVKPVAKKTPAKKPAAKKVSGKNKKEIKPAAKKVEDNFIPGATLGEKSNEFLEIIKAVFDNDVDPELKEKAKKENVGVDISPELLLEDRTEGFKEIKISILLIIFKDSHKKDIGVILEEEHFNLKSAYTRLKLNVAIKNNSNEAIENNPKSSKGKIILYLTIFSLMIGSVVFFLNLIQNETKKQTSELNISQEENPIIVTKNSKADEIVTESTISVDNDEVVTTFDKGDGYIQNKSKPHNFPTGVYHRNEVIISISNEGIITDDSDRELDCEKIQGNDGCVVRDDHLNLSYVFLPFTDKKGFESIVIYVYPQKSYRMLIKGIDPGKSIKHFVLKKFV